jgi:hypothetical protein
MTKETFISIADDNWKDWRVYILPTQIYEERQKQFDDKLEKGERPIDRDDFCTILFQKEFSDQVAFVLQAINYIKDKQDILNKSHEEREELINKIDLLMRKSSRSERHSLKYLLNTGVISDKDCKKYLLKDKQSLSSSNLELAAGEVLNHLCIVYGFLLDSVSLLNEDSDESASSYLYETIGIINSINQTFYQFKNMAVKNKGAQATVQKKQTAKAVAETLWQKHNLGRDDAAIIDLKRIYEKETGKKLKPGIRTIKETWLPFWNKTTN